MTQPSKTQFLTTDGGEIAYSDTGGKGHLILAAPGMGDVRAVYRHLTPRLAEAGYRVVTMDLRGAGESSVTWPSYEDRDIAADMLALAEHLESGPATLMGNSLSAGSAVIAAHRSPDAVRGLIFLGPFVRNVPAPGWQKLSFKLVLLPPWGRKAWVGYYRKQMYPSHPPPDHDTYVAALADKLAENGRFGAFSALAFNSHDDSDAVLDDVEQPMLIVIGTKDPDYPDPTAEGTYLAERTGGRLELIDGVGHYPQAEAPEQTATVIDDFISTLDAP